MGSFNPPTWLMISLCFAIKVTDCHEIVRLQSTSDPYFPDSESDDLQLHTLQVSNVSSETLQFPYIAPMFLGMTYDVSCDKAGDIIFREPAQNAIIQEENKLLSNFTLFATSREAYEATGLTSDLILKVKTEVVNIPVIGDYLKSINEEGDEVIEIVVIQRYFSENKKLPLNAQPDEGWEKEGRGVLGTHFVSAISYGAEMIASIRIVPKKLIDRENVFAMVERTFGRTGAIDSLLAEGKLEKFKRMLRNKATFEISFYSHLNSSLLNTVEGLRRFVKEFRNYVQNKSQSKKYHPILVDLKPLAHLTSNQEAKEKFQFVKNKKLMAELEEFLEKFDDLKSAKKALNEITRMPPPILRFEYEKLIIRLSKKIDTVLRIFYKVIRNVNIERGPQQLRPAISVFRKERNIQWGKFRKHVDKIISFANGSTKMEVETTGDEDADNKQFGTYIQWGASTCQDDLLKTFLSGYSAIKRQQGKDVNFICVPQHIQDNITVNTTSVISYGSLGYNPFYAEFKHQLNEKIVPCAWCFEPLHSSAVEVFLGFDSCPSGWTEEYAGFMMSTAESKDSICVDKHPSPPYEHEESHLPKENLFFVVFHSRDHVEKNRDDSAIKCAVCSRLIDEKTED